MYGDENISVIRPADQLLIPSNSDWRVNLDLVVEAIVGNPLELLNKTISQFLEDGVTPFAYGTVNNVEEFYEALKRVTNASIKLSGIYPGYFGNYAFVLNLNDQNK